MTDAECPGTRSIVGSRNRCSRTMIEGHSHNMGHFADALAIEERERERWNRCNECEWPGGVRCGYHQNRWEGFKDGQMDGYLKAKAEKDE